MNLLNVPLILSKDQAFRCLPNVGKVKYHVGEVTGPYYYVAGGLLPHRRPVKWIPVQIDRSAMSEVLRNTTRSVGTVCNVSRAGLAEEV